MSNDKKVFHLEEIDTINLFTELNTENIHIIDIRSIDSYNGWKENGEIRGGHIKGARSLPYKWLNYIDWIEIVESKGIIKSHKLIVYGYDRNRIDKVANQFIRAGYNSVRVYYHFTSQWSCNSQYPVEYMKKYRQLVSASWLKCLIDEGKIHELDNNRFVICHAHYRNRNAYEEGHIPGAIDLDTNYLESSETWNRHNPAELKKNLESWGITSGTTVILYGRFSSPDNNDQFPGSSAGHLGAIRCALIMMYAGVKDVRILNGGLQSWIDEGYQLSKEDYYPEPVGDFGVGIPAEPGLIVDMEEAKGILKASDKNLVSIRSWPEFIGEVSGYNYIKKKGRIPGAVFGNCGSDAYHMENYRNLDHTTREYHEIEKLWAEVDILPHKHNAFYCGTGWRGSEAWFNAWLMGWPRVSVYDGGWFEWSNDETNPFETGHPEEM